jgi:uncharacterized membrane protein
MSPRSDTKPIRGNREAAKNIESILRLEKEEEGKLSSFHRFSHAIGEFVGTIQFVTLQCLFVLIWVAGNGRILASFTPIDPYPYPLLGGALALESVLLTSFVLIRQNVMDRRSERRNHLDLQINMLAEKEATSILRILRDIAEHLDVDVKHDPARDELAEDTAVEGIARDLRSKENRS